jgi:TRAP transporter TAXI family solute receptor
MAPRILARFLAAVLVLAPAAARAQDAFVSLGSGSSAGVYYKVAKAICDIVNRDVPSSVVRCSPEATPGSIYNLQRLATRELDLAIVQSDLQHEAFVGENPPNGAPMPELRSVLSLHGELLTVIAPYRAGVSSIADLNGKRVNAGPLGSGTRATWNLIAETLGEAAGGGPRTSALRLDSTTSPLCAGNLDANIMLVGHPSGFVRQQLDACPTKLVPLEGPAIDRYLAAHPSVHRGVIDGSLYGNRPDTPTIGVTATLVTTASADPRVIQAIVKAILADLDEFKAMHPALSALDPSEMARKGLTAPMHPGAAKAFQEAGLR